METISKGLRKYESLKVCMEQNENNIKASKEFLDQLYAFKRYWVNRNPMHLEYLASNLTGCYPIRFSQDDESKFYGELLNLDRHTMKREIHSVKDMNTSFIIASNPTYHICLYIMHIFMTSKLSQDNINFGIELAYFIMSIKMLGSLDSHFFANYPAEIGVAEAVYNRLSERFLIKRKGSWDEVIRHSYESDVKPGTGTLAKDILQYNNTKVLMNAVSFIQTRYRNIIKNIYSVIVEIQEEKLRIQTKSKIEIGLDGEEGVAKLADREDKYVDYLKSIIFQPLDFIKDDYVMLVAVTYGGIEMECLKDALEVLSTSESRLKHDVVGITLPAMIGYLRSKGIQDHYRKELRNCIKILKNYWNNLGAKEVSVRPIRKELIDLISKVHSIKVKSKRNSVAGAMLTYLFVRAVIMKIDF